MLHARPGHLVQTLLVAVLYITPALLCLRLAVVADPDLWLHLHTGEWIVQHGAVPRTDPFSTFGAGKPWVAYSWLFELSVLQLSQRWGLAGIVAYSCAMVLAITVALHHLIRRLQPDFHISLLLTLVACIGIVPSFTPRPWLFSILFFILELDILMHARSSGRARELAGLPVLFAIWANVHIQFIDGLVVLAIAVADAVLSRRRPGAAARVPLRWLCGAFIASVLATLANPYGWYVYKAAYDLVSQTGVQNRILELQAMPFRNIANFFVLFLALGAAAALGRRRRFLPFETALLAFAAIISFRSQRDEWVLATIASAILAAGWVARERTAYRLPAVATWLVALAASLVVLLGFRAMHVTNAGLQAQLANDTPVRAVEFVKAKGYHGPLFNDFNFAGYLIWTLQLPVSIDGRTAVHGDKQFERSLSTWSAEPDWASDPQLRSAALVIGWIEWPLTRVLRMDPRFELVYEDKLAAVFVARRVLESPQ